MTLEELYTLKRIMELGQREVECAACDGIGTRTQTCFDTVHKCRVCHGTGKVPDPRYNALVEALTEECSACDGTGQIWTHGGLGKIGHARCGGSGRVLRPWEDLPQGALAGVLFHWAVRQYSLLPTQYIPESREHRLWRVLVSDLEDAFWRADGNEWAAKVVLEAMMKEAIHAE